MEEIRIGKPPAFKTDEELVSKIEEYFNTTPNNNVTITGIALYLGFQSRQSFYDYEKKSDFAYTIRRARLIIENGYETILKGGDNNTGSIFALKNFGWTDRQDINQNITADVKTSKKYDLSKLNDEELEAYENLAKKAMGDEDE